MPDYRVLALTSGGVHFVEIGGVAQSACSWVIRRKVDRYPISYFLFEYNSFAGKRSHQKERCIQEIYALKAVLELSEGDCIVESIEKPRNKTPKKPEPRQLKLWGGE